MSELKTAKKIWFKSKVIFRASGLSLLGISNTHVEKDRKKIEEGKPLSPILLVRDKRNGKRTATTVCAPSIRITRTN